MLIIGLTGGVASGKSTVAKLFQQLGANVISADAINRALIEKDTACYDEIVQHFGETILLSDKQLDKHQLRDIIFNDREEKKWLESLLHPKIQQEIQRQIKLSTTTYCIIEIPLLKDKFSYPFIDRILIVDVCEETQIERLTKRDGISTTQAQQMLNAQISRSQRLRLADDIIDNESSPKDLLTIVNKYHQSYSTNHINIK